MATEELEAVRVEMRNRLAAIAKNLLDFDEFAAFAANVAEGEKEELWAKFRRGDIMLDRWADPVTPEVLASGARGYCIDDRPQFTPDFAERMARVREGQERHAAGEFPIIVT